MLRAGFARVDITPPADVSLMGYAFRHESLPPGNDGPADPLYARALAFEDDAGPAVLVSLDLCIISTALARRLREQIAERIGAARERVLVATTHTHSGPALDEPNEAHTGHTEMPPDGWDVGDSPGRRYLVNLIPKVLDAAARAAGLTVPVRVATAEAPLGIGYNRRAITTEGLRHCWNPEEQALLRPGPSPDPTCTVAVFEQIGGPRRFVLWSVAAHPVVLGKTSRVVGPDWPGIACGVVERVLPESRAIFLQGAAGNVHPWVATQERLDGVSRVAGAAGSFAALLARGTRSPENEDTVATAIRTLTFADVSLDLAAWRIGPLAIAAAPVELFAELGAAVRERTNGPLIVATTAGGWTGYWPTPEAFEEGGYEVDLARESGRSGDDSLQLVDELADLVASVR